jgi:hypothetical protein
LINCRVEFRECRGFTGKVRRAAPQVLVRELDKLGEQEMAGDIARDGIFRRMTEVRWKGSGVDGPGL